MLKPEYEPVTREDLKLEFEDSGMPCAVIVDGRIIKTDFDCCNMTMEKLKKIIKKDKINVDNTLLKTIDKKGNKTIIGKDQK